MKIKKLVENHMTPYPSIASEDMSIREASEFMKKNRIRHLPIVNHGKVVGIVSERDLKQAEILSDAMQVIVSDVMTPNPYCAIVGTPLSEVAHEMAKHKYGCAVVLNGTAIVGIFTSTDGMRVLSSLLSSDKGNLLQNLGVEQFFAGDYLV
jgi:acetoin utilization protein AcuB